MGRCEWLLLTIHWERNHQGVCAWLSKQETEYPSPLLQQELVPQRSFTPSCVERGRPGDLGTTVLTASPERTGVLRPEVHFEFLSPRQPCETWVFCSAPRPVYTHGEDLGSKKSCAEAMRGGSSLVSRFKARQHPVVAQLLNRGRALHLGVFLRGRRPGPGHPDPPISWVHAPSGVWSERMTLHVRKINLGNKHVLRKSLRAFTPHPLFVRGCGLPSCSCGLM